MKGNAMLHDALSAQATMLLEMVGVSIQPHPREAGVWLYTTANGEQGRGCSPMHAAIVGMGRVRLMVQDLEAARDALALDLAAARAELAMLRTHAAEPGVRKESLPAWPRVNAIDAFAHRDEPLTLAHLSTDGSHADV
jgi:hypothetical protein